MGWLSEQNPLKSVRALAQQMLRDPECPDRDLKVEHLANMLRKVDKGDSAWFFGAGQAWVAGLARAMDRAEDEVRLELQGRAPPAVRSLLPIPGFEDLRPLDLQVEGLPPGLPHLPSEWSIKRGRDAVAWWTTRRGPGQELLTRWASWDARWRVVEVGTWHDLAIDLDDGIPTLVVLGSSEGAPEEPPDLNEERSALWVVCPQAPPAGAPDEPPQAPPVGTSNEPEADLTSRSAPSTSPRSGWSLTKVGRITTWLPRLFDWVEERYREGGGLDLRLLEEPLQDPNSWLYAHVQSFDHALELFALCDQIGTKVVIGDTETKKGAESYGKKVVAAWMKLQAQRLEQRDPGLAAALAHDGARLLTSIECNRLLGLHPDTLPLGSWQDCVPVDLPKEQRAEEIVRLALSNDFDAVKRLAAQPTAQQVIAGLCELGLLEGEGEQWRMGRPLVQFALRGLVIPCLLRSGWTGVGALLLSPGHVEDALEALSGAFDSRQGLHEPVPRADIERTLREADARDPRGAAAVDGACRAVAIACLRGVEVPTATVRLAWSTLRASGCALWPHHPPVPMLRMASRPRPPGASGWSGGSEPVHVRGLTGEGGWFLAALALSRALVSRGGVVESGPLAPWCSPEEYADLAWKALQLASHSLGAYPHAVECDVCEDPGGWCDGLAVSLIEAGALPPVGTFPSGLAAGEIIVRASGGAWLDDASLSAALRLELGLAPLLDACQRHGRSVDEVLGWCWRRWIAGDWRYPPFLWLNPHSPHVFRDLAPRLWQTLPPDVVRAEHLRTLEAAAEGLQHLPAALWPGILDLILAADQGQYRLWFPWNQLIPPGLLLGAICQGRFVEDSELVGRLWQEVPQLCLDAIDRLARALPEAGAAAPAGGSHSPLLVLLQGAPPSHNGDLLDRIEAWLDHRSDWPGAPPSRILVIHLYRQVEAREQGWTQAWALLQRLSPELASPPQ